jgi:hypothetical protein
MNQDEPDFSLDTPEVLFESLFHTCHLFLYALKLVRQRFLSNLKQFIIGRPTHNKVLKYLVK